ncbi:hypothetical protein [Streptomyces sp. NPDC059616]|uniref:hypothetical protein n=1 Tax=Streptomyces sp. NPDC059616 TaxID=3346886 RepID=UPI00367A285D
MSGPGTACGELSTTDHCATSGRAAAISANAVRMLRAVGLSSRAASTIRRCPSDTRWSTARWIPYQWSEQTESRACSALPGRGRRSISTVGTPTFASQP